MDILICGGAGYIGSHMVKLALDQGHQVMVVDNLSTGHADALAALELAPANLLQADIGDKALLRSLLSEHSFDLIMHFCAHSLVGESVQNPLMYYRNNVGNTLSLLESMNETGHKHLVFSSSAAVYGNPQSDVIDEIHPCNPINPYGQSKRMVEQILQDAAQAYGINSISLRYFNAAGADPSSMIGEKHNPETHLIPNILKSIPSSRTPELKVFGTDYPTRDGSCVRDYIHVNDLASAHLLAGDFLAENPGAHQFNLGLGNGFSVLEVIGAARAVTGQEIRYEIAPRRFGDPPVLVANANKAGEILGWKPEVTDLKDIIQTAWGWHRNGEFFSRKSH